MLERSQHGKLIKPCPDCGNEFETPLYIGRPVAAWCPDCQSRRSRAFEIEELERHRLIKAFHRVEWLKSKVGIPPKYRGLKWDDFKYDNGGTGNRAKVEELRRWAANFPVEDKTDLNPNPQSRVRSLLLSRDVNGVGKTMLACLILQDLINRYENIARELPPFQFWTMPDVELRLSAAQRFGSSETEEDVYEHLSTVALLVLDDVGKDKLVGASIANTQHFYFTLLNKRYNNELPVVITSNVEYRPFVEGGFTLYDVMGNAGASRLMEMTQGITYLIEGEDRR